MKKRFIILTGIAITGLIFSSSILLAKEVPIRLGFVYIMSGSYGAYGQFAQKGAQLAIDEINETGGINGRPLEAIFENSRSKPDVAIEAIRKLVLEDSADFLIGIDSSKVARAVAPVLMELKTPLIITNAATTDVTGPLCNKYLFRISLNLAQQVKSAARLAGETDIGRWTTVGRKHIYSYQSWDFFSKYLKTLKPDVQLLKKEEAIFIPSKKKDLRPYIRQVLHSNARGVLVTLWGKYLMRFMLQADELGLFKKDFMVLSTMAANTDILTALGAKMPTGVWISSGYWFLANDSPMNRKFNEAYYLRYGDYPSYNAHNAYGAVYTYKAAVQKAGSINKETVAAALEGLSLELPTGTITLRPEDHQATVDACWGKSYADPSYPIRILNPKRVFRGAEIVRPVAETGCTMR